MGQARSRRKAELAQIFAATISIAFLGGAAIAQVRALGPTTALKSLTITSEPNASVWVDGVLYGKTDEKGSLKIRTAAGGTHTVRVRAAGFKDVSKPLPAAQSGAVQIALVKTTDEAELALQQAESLASVDREKAAAAYRKAASLRPNYLDAWIALARVYSEAGDFQNTMKAVREGRKIKPGVAELSAIEGRIYKDTGDEDKAIAAFKRAIAEGKGFQPEAYTGLGLLYKDRAEAAGAEDRQTEEASYREAVKYLSTAARQLAGSPDGIVVYQLLGLIYEKQKKCNEAIALYQDFLRIYPDAPEATAVQSFITQIKKQMAEQP